MGHDSLVDIATGYGLEGPGIETRWDRDFPHLSRPALGPTQPMYNGYRVFPGGKERPGRAADPSPLLVPWSRKSRAIPLLPLWAVRPAQSLSPCIRVHFTSLLSRGIPLLTEIWYFSLVAIHLKKIIYISKYNKIDKNYIKKIRPASWSSGQVPGSIPGSTMGIFPCRERFPW